MRRDASSHFLDLPFLPFFFLLLFLRPPGMTGFIAGGLVGDGDGAEASVVVAAAAEERKQIDWRSRAAFVRLRLTIVLSAPRGFALILSLAAQSAKKQGGQKSELASVRH